MKVLRVTFDGKQVTIPEPFFTRPEGHPGPVRSLHVGRVSGRCFVHWHGGRWEEVSPERMETLCRAHAISVPPNLLRVL